MGTRVRRSIHAATLLSFAGCLLALAACGGSDVKLVATKLTLELAYKATGEAAANLEGQPGAAPQGASIACRLTADHDWRLGEGEAGPDGSFEVPLDARAYPLDALDPQRFTELNESLECQAEGGPWVKPLRQPRVAIE